MLCAAVVLVVAPNSGAGFVDADLIEDAIYNTILAAALGHHGKRYGAIRSQRDPTTREVNLAKPNQYTVLILGAWGCGASRNYPNFMADRFTVALAKYREEIALCWNEMHSPIANTQGEEDFNREHFKHALGQFCRC